MIDRREFLSAAAAGTAVVLTTAAIVDHEPRSEAHDFARPELLLALGASTACEIGEAYRALVPAESDRASLETVLRAELGAPRSSIEDAVRADFAADRVIVVRDWLLSVTEARQCALFSLRSA